MLAHLHEDLGLDKCWVVSQGSSGEVEMKRKGNKEKREMEKEGGTFRCAPSVRHLGGGGAVRLGGDASERGGG